MQIAPLMESQELIIHLDWSGPYSFNEISSLSGPTDYGIYQIYGTHSLYGSGVLLYIGLACDQKFAERLAQHKWCSVNQDSGRLQFYVGRLFGRATPDNQEWSRCIKLAERLLIYANKPAENTQKELGALDSELWHVHVLNWSQYRDLLPEVSGARWSNRFETLPCKPHFSTADYAVKAN